MLSLAFSRTHAYRARPRCAPVGRRVITVNWPRDFEHYASATYKAYRDNADVRKEMVGWTLTTAGLGLPKSLGKAPSAGTEEEISTTHAAFKYNKKWKFSLSGVALQTLAEEYSKPLSELLTQSLNSTHFLKMAAKAKSSARCHSNLRTRPLRAHTAALSRCVRVQVRMRKGGEGGGEGGQP